ncbi:MAG: hypothetical protein ABII79_12450 [bacterium]
MGMALDEPKEKLEKLESNGVTAYIEPELRQMLKQYGQIHIDYISNEMQGSGFTIKVGNQDCSSKGCSC